MAIELIAKIAPKNDGFIGMVDAEQVLGGDDSGYLPNSCVSVSNIIQHVGSIDHSDISGTHNLTTDIDHDGLTNTHNLTTDIDHDSLTNTHNLTTDIDHDSLTNTHNLTTDIDHNTITNSHNLTTSIDHNTITNSHNLTTSIDHSAISNIAWSSAGHTIDANIVMSDNSVTGLDTVVFTDADGYISDGVINVTVSNAVTGYTHSQLTHDYDYITGNDGGTDITAAELEELSDGSETTLHSHAAGSGATVALDNLATVSINTTLVSDADNVDDLGTPAARWKDLYLSGNLNDNTNTATVSNLVTAFNYSQVGHLPLAGGTMTGNIEIGDNQLRNSNASESLNLYGTDGFDFRYSGGVMAYLASSVFQFYVSILPGYDDAQDLGTSDGPGRWRNIYLSGFVSDLTNTFTVSNAVTAYTHSQISGTDTVHVTTAENGQWDTAYLHSQISSANTIHVTTTENQQWDSAFSHSLSNTQAHSDYLKNDAVDAGVGLTLSGDNSSADTAYVPMVLYNTDDTPPAASGFPIGTVYIQYTA